MAYTGIASTVISGTGTSSTTFSSIPQTYKDLIVRVSFNSTGATNLLLRWNGYPNGYSYIKYDANVATNYPLPNDNINLCISPGTTSHANKFTVGEILINNYTNTTNQKPFTGTFGGYNPGTSTYTLSAFQSGNGNSISPNAAISSLTFYVASGAFANGTRFDLYGVS